MCYLDERDLNLPMHVPNIHEIHNIIVFPKRDTIDDCIQVSLMYFHPCTFHLRLENNEIELSSIQPKLQLTPILFTLLMNDSR